MTLYEKLGRRYHPVAETVLIDSLPEGAHLVIVKPGLKTVTCGIEPDHASLLAAAVEAKDAMCTAIQAASASEPTRALTPLQQDTLDLFKAAGGLPMFTRKCAADIAKAGIDALIEAAARKETNDGR